MSIKWIKRDSFKPEAVLNTLRNIPDLQQSSIVDGNYIDVEIATWVLLNMLLWPDAVDTKSRFRITKKSIYTCVRSKEFSNSQFLATTNSVLKQYMTGIKDKQFTVLTSLSLHPSFSVKNLQLGATKIRFLSGSYSKRLASQRESTIRRPVSDMWQNYKMISAVTTARFPNQALSVVMGELNTIRALLCLRANSEHVLFGSSMSGPLNKIRFGAFSTIHSGSECWNVEFNHPQSPASLYRFHTVDNDRNIVDRGRPYHVNYFNLLFEHNYKDILQSALISYVNALDESDPNNALIRLWSTLEKLCGDAESNVLQCSGLYPNDHQYMKQVLECIREYRNQCIHRSTRSDRAYMLCMQLQNIFRDLIFFHLFNGFETLEETRGFLSLPADIEVLRERKRMIDKKIELST